MKQITLLALFLVACDSRPLPIPPDIVNIITNPPPDTVCHAVQGGFYCDLTGGVSQDCDECSPDVSCKTTGCGYCMRYGLTGASVPVHRFAGLLCVPLDPNEPDRIDCSGCQVPRTPACITIDSPLDCHWCTASVSILTGCPIPGQCDDPAANFCPSEDCTACP